MYVDFFFNMRFRVSKKLIPPQEFFEKIIKSPYPISDPPESIFPHKNVKFPRFRPENRTKKQPKMVDFGLKIFLPTPRISNIFICR